MINAYLIRVMLTETRWTDVKIYADTWFNARDLGAGQSPIGRAFFMNNLSE